MRQTLLSFFILFVFTCSAQFNHINYKKDCDLAYRLSIDSAKYEASNLLLDKVKSKYKKLYGEEYALMAYNFNQLGNTSNSAQALKDTWSNPFFEWEYTFRINALAPASIMKNYTDTDKKLVEEGFENFAKLKGPKFDSLMKVFQVMESFVQMPLMKPLLTKQDSITKAAEIHLADSINLIQFKNIILKMGYPGEWILPGNSTKSLPFLINSANNNEFFIEMKEVLYQEVIKGHMPATFYAAWIDLHSVSLKQPTEYGMLNNRDYSKVSSVERRRIQRKRLELGIVSSFPIPVK